MIAGDVEGRENKRAEWGRVPGSCTSLSREISSCSGIIAGLTDTKDSSRMLNRERIRSE